MLPLVSCCWYVWHLFHEKTTELPFQQLATQTGENCEVCQSAFALYMAIKLERKTDGHRWVSSSCTQTSNIHLSHGCLLGFRWLLNNQKWAVCKLFTWMLTYSSLWQQHMREVGAADGKRRLGQQYGQCHTWTLSAVDFFKKGELECVDHGAGAESRGGWFGGEGGNVVTLLVPSWLTLAVCL